MVSCLLMLGQAKKRAQVSKVTQFRPRRARFPERNLALRLGEGSSHAIFESPTGSASGGSFARHFAIALQNLEHNAAIPWRSGQCDMSAAQGTEPPSPTLA